MARVHTLFDGEARTALTTDEFINFDSNIGLQIDNQEDVPLDVILQGRADGNCPWGDAIDNSGTALSINVAAGEDKFITFGKIPINSRLRVSCDASAAVSGTVMIKAIG